MKINLHYLRSEYAHWMHRHAHRKLKLFHSVLYKQK